MTKLDKIIVFWGICDILFFAVYLFSSISNGEIPFYSDLTIALNNVNAFFDGSSSFILIPILGLILYISIPISGYLLILRKKSGVILALCQIPFRLGLVAPSLYFIFWIFGLFAATPFAVGILLLLVTELFKLFTLVKWKRISVSVANKPLQGTC